MIWCIWMLFIFIGAKWKKQDLTCSPGQQLGVSCSCFWCLLMSHFCTFFFLWIYEFLSYTSGIGLAGTCSALEVPLGSGVGQQTACHHPPTSGELAAQTAPIAWAVKQGHIIEGISREQKCLHFIYSIIVDGWKAISQLCLGADWQ